MRIEPAVNQYFTTKVEIKMETIWKIELKITDSQVIKAPAGSQYLDVQIQNGKPCLWLKVDPEFADTEYRIFTYGTGHKISEKTGVYIGTYQTENCVFHVFDGLDI